MLINRLYFLWIMDFCNLYIHIHEEMGHEVYSVYMYDFSHSSSFQLQVYRSTPCNCAYRHSNENKPPQEHFCPRTAHATKILKKNWLNVTRALYTLFRPEVVRFQKFQQQLL